MNIGTEYNDAKILLCTPTRLTFCAVNKQSLANTLTAVSPANDQFLAFARTVFGFHGFSHDFSAASSGVGTAADSTGGAATEPSGAGGAYQYKLRFKS